MDPLDGNALDWISDLARADSLAVLVDLDGTLVPFARMSTDAVLDDGARSLLHDLESTGAHVVVVSGRTRADAEALRRASPRTWWVAEHGAWKCAGDEWSGPAAPAAELESLVAAWSAVAARTPGAWIELKSLSACFHWRDVAGAERSALIAQVEAIVDEWLDPEADFERMPGVTCLQVRRRGAHKGLAVEWIRDRLPDVRILALGDDVTDEDMFAALGHRDMAVLASVSPGRPSRAAVWVDGPAEVRRLLRCVVEARASARGLPPGLLKGRRALASTRSGPERLLVVSNRTPAAAREGDRAREVGGLVSALEPALRDRDGIWLGWSGRERDGQPALIVDDVAAPSRAQFDFPPVWRRRFYGGLCNRALWPLLHGLIGRVVYEDEDWAAYTDANAAYARFAHQLVGPDATIWIHDYHLLLAARELRALGHRGPIGLFVHVPFPGCDELETLPWCREILQAMRSFDLVGFHCERWASNFRACASALDEGVSTVDVFPLGVDAGAFAPARAHPVPTDVAGLCAGLGTRRLLLGVDRLDYSKGIPERLRAYERLLDREPAWRRNVVLVQVSVPSRADVPEYAELRGTVENLVGRINGRFGDADWVPVRCLFRAYEREALAALYRAAAVALVTPLRDGMNLVAKEFVAAQAASNPGVLVLSRFAGAAHELRDAVLTNPFHLDGLAGDLDRALRMSLQERRARHESLARVVERSSPARWASGFLARLEEAARVEGAARVKR